MQYASLGKRFASHLIDRVIDALIVTLAFMLAYVPVMVIAVASGNNENMDGIIGLAVLFVYCLILMAVLAYLYVRYAYLPSKSGQTWAQKLLNIKMVREDGSVPSQGKLIIRYVVLELLGLISLIGLLIDDEKKSQTIHDMAAKTVVVNA